MQKINLVFTTIGIAILVVLAGYFAIQYLSISVPGFGRVLVVSPANSSQSLQKILSSKVLNPISGSGKVVKIDKNTITLMQDGDEFSFLADQNANIVAFSVSNSDSKTKTAVSSTQKKIELKDIKVGDTITARFQIQANGLVTSNSMAVNQK